MGHQGGKMESRLVPIGWKIMTSIELANEKGMRRSERTDTHAHTERAESWPIKVAKAPTQALGGKKQTGNCNNARKKGGPGSSQGWVENEVRGHCEWELIKFKLTHFAYIWGRRNEPHSSFERGSDRFDFWTWPKALRLLLWPAGKTRKLGLDVRCWALPDTWTRLKFFRYIYHNLFYGYSSSKMVTTRVILCQLTKKRKKVLFNNVWMKWWWLGNLVSKGLFCEIGRPFWWRTQNIEKKTCFW